MRAGLLASALLLGGLGQWSFGGGDRFLFDGLFLYGCAVAAFVLALSRRRPDPPPPARLAAGPAAAAHPRPAGLAAAAILGIALAWLLAGQHSPGRVGAAALLWLAAIAVVLWTAGVFDARGGERRGRAARRIDLAWVVGLGALALLMRVSLLGSVPANLSGDEAGWGLDAVRVLRGELRDPFGFGWWGQPTLAFFFAAPSLGLFGQEAFGLRLPWAVVGSLTAPLTYLLGARLLGRTVGAAAGLLVATWGFAIHFSRVGHGMAPDAMLAALAVLLFVRGAGAREQGPAARAWAGCGAACGLAVYGYSGARFVPVLIVALALAWMLVSVRRRGPAAGLRRVSGGLATVALVAVVVALPLVVAAIREPGQLNARLQQVGVFQSGWLERETVILGQSRGRILLDQLARSALAFNLYPDAQSHYGSPRPLLGPAAGVLFLLGLGWCTWRWRRARCFPLVVWWWGGLMGTVLTTSPPAAQRMSILAPPTALFVAVALVESLRLAARSLGSVRWSAGAGRRSTAGAATPRARLGARARTVTAAAVAAALALGAHSAWDYFARYTPSRVFGNPDALLATELGRWARRDLPQGARLVFFGAPRIYVGFATIPFLAPHVEGVDVLEPLTAAPQRELGCGDGPAAFAFVPGRAGELALVRVSFPDGRELSARGPDGGLLYVVWLVDDPCTSFEPGDDGGGHVPDPRPGENAATGNPRG
jgi:4-amino-4-deoxy-L-arabinose transferase-like glycosyltransferase